MQPRRLNGVLFLCALLVAWEIVAQAQWINPLIVPPLSRILRIFWEQVSSGQIPAQILVSMKRAAAGYFLAAAVFIPLGIFMGLSQRIYSLFEVIVEMLRPVPPPVLIPLAMLFFGLEDKMKIFVIFFPAPGRSCSIRSTACAASTRCWRTPAGRSACRA